KTFRDAGLTPENISYSVGDKLVRNIAVEIKGAASSGDVLIIGAHYDTVPGTPGANDNATGIASLLELARLCSQEPPAQNLRLVAFV
ncbi:aminopeptidase, partial [Enterococcus hirae]